MDPLVPAGTAGLSEHPGLEQRVRDDDWSRGRGFGSSAGAGCWAKNECCAG